MTPADTPDKAISEAAREAVDTLWDEGHLVDLYVDRSDARRWCGPIIQHAIDTANAELKAEAGRLTAERDENLTDKVTRTPEEMRLFQQERAIMEVTELISRLMDEHGMTKADLAKKLGTSKASITQMLDGRRCLTVRTISDVLFVLDSALKVSAADLWEVMDPEGEAEIATLKQQLADAKAETRKAALEEAGKEVRRVYLEHDMLFDDEREGVPPDEAETHDAIALALVGIMGTLDRMAATPPTTDAEPKD